MENNLTRSLVMLLSYAWVVESHCLFLVKSIHLSKDIITLFVSCGGRCVENFKFCWNMSLDLARFSNGLGQGSDRD